MMSSGVDQLEKCSLGSQRRQSGKVVEPKLRWAWRARVLVVDDVDVEVLAEDGSYHGVPERSRKRKYISSVESMPVILKIPS